MIKKEIAYQDIVTDFVTQLMKKRQLGNVDPEVIDQLKKDLADRLVDQINAMIVDKLPKDKLADFEHLLDTGTTQEIQDFSLAHIPNLNSLIAAILADFADSYLR